MPFQNHPSVLPLLVGGAVLWINAIYLFWRTRSGRRAPGQLLAAGLVACFAISVSAFALEQAHTAIGPKVFWNQMEYVGDAPLTAFLLAFVIVYVGYDHTWRTYAVLFALPIVTVVGVFSNSLHHLYWSSLSLGEVAGFVVLDNGAGPLFYLYLLYTYVFLLASLFLLARASVDSTHPHRRHLLAIGVGAILPAVAGIAYVLGLGPTPTPNYPGYAYIGTAATITYSIHRHDVFTVLPIANRTALEQMDDGVVTLDDQDCIVGVNGAAKDFLGAAGDELIGQHARDVLGAFLTDNTPTHDDNQNPHSGAESRQRATVETGDRVFDVTTRPLTRRSRRVGRLVILHEVTDRHRREQRLAELNTRLKLALEETDTGVWEWVIETDDIAWDEASERLYDYEPGEFPGTYEAFTDRVVSEDVTTVEDQIKTAIQTDGEYEAEFRIQLPGGERRWIQARGVVQFEEGEPSRLFGIQTDISDRKIYEQQLEEKNRKLELLNRIIRHDIQNEASLALNFIHRLDRVHSDDGHNEYLEGIAQTAERIIDLTEASRDLIDAVSQLDEELKPVALAPVLERAVANASDRSTSATVRFEGEIPKVELRANDAISSVFRNLLSNAIQHNDREKCEVVVSVTREGDTVRIDVADDGPGIPDEYKESVFQEGRTLAKSSGTGYGLYLVETIVTAYNGSVEISDREPRGTIVSVSLPIVQEENQIQARERAAREGGEISPNK